jgi:hypothetical protein
MFETLKLLYRAKPKILSLLVFLIVSFAILHMFSVWQLDLVVRPPVWDYGWVQPSPRYADQYFQCWIWRTAVGEAYDTLFFLNFISFYGVIIIFVILLYYAIKTLKKEALSASKCDEERKR